jgi:hypothetical protein
MLSGVGGVDPRRVHRSMINLMLQASHRAPRRNNRCAVRIIFRSQESWLKHQNCRVLPDTISLTELFRVHSHCAVQELNIVLDKLVVDRVFGVENPYDSHTHQPLFV